MVFVLIIRLISMKTTNGCLAFNMSGKVKDSRSKVTKMAGKCGKYDESIFSVEFLCLVHPLCLEQILSSTSLPGSMSRMSLWELLVWLPPL